MQNPGEGLEYNLAFAPTKDFKYETARARIMQLGLDMFATRTNAHGDGLSDTEKKRLLGSEIDLEAKEAVCAAGGLRA
jgi:hypothetical protein